MIQRLVDFPKKQSFFLFGARGCGKTTLLQQRYSTKDSLFIDLLDVRLFQELLLDPGRFLDLIDSKPHRHKRVIVDEIQKLPILLDIIHQQIQKKNRQFILTGSSSRRLKQKGTNLLAGRAWIYYLYPFTSLELGKNFNLKRSLELGGLPTATLAKSAGQAKEYLKAYTGTYLEKEIQLEKWVRQLQPFRRFLSVASQMNGQIINKSKIAKDVGVDDVTVANYFDILEDSLLGFMLPAFDRSVRKSQRQGAKFYFIDPGIKRAVLGELSLPLVPQTYDYGKAFEHWVLLEFIKLISYKRLDWTCFYLRTKANVEIDLIIQKPKGFLLIEFKSKPKVKAEDAKALESLGKDIDPKANKWLISKDPLEHKFGGTRALHWQTALKELF